MVSGLRSAVDTVEAEVRELVRRRGLDPVENRLAMRRLIDEVVLDYDERALSSTMPALPDEVVPALVEPEVAVPRLTPTVRWELGVPPRTSTSDRDRCEGLPEDCAGHTRGA